jgi:hypothetical protein
MFPFRNHVAVATPIVRKEIDMAEARVQTQTSFFHQAAKASWLAPVIAIIANFFLRNARELDQRAAIMGLFLVALYGLGLILGVLAMTGIPKHGRRGILIPALIGVVLNAGILVIVVAVFASNL